MKWKVSVNNGIGTHFQYVEAYSHEEAKALGCAEYWKSKRKAVGANYPIEKPISVRAKIVKDPTP
jgi:hypothetical protein